MTGESESILKAPRSPQPSSGRSPIASNWHSTCYADASAGGVCKVKWPFGRKEEEPDWYERVPGEDGTNPDEFVTFTYFVPSDSLRESYVEDARQAGELGVPDLGVPDPILDPDGLQRLRAIVTEVIFGRKGAATVIFRPTADGIARISQVLQGSNGRADIRGDTPNDRRDRAAFAQLPARLAALEATMQSLEKALDARQAALVAHYEQMSSDYAHELKQRHPLPDRLSSRWWPAPLTITRVMRDFGQFEAQERIDRAREAIKRGALSDGEGA